MTNDMLTEMWTALERYQPIADKYSFGAAWLRLTTEHSIDAARSAGRASLDQYAAWAAESAYEALKAILSRNEGLAPARESDIQAHQAEVIRIIDMAIALAARSRIIDTCINLTRAERERIEDALDDVERYGANAAAIARAASENRIARDLLEYQYERRCAAWRAANGYDDAY